LLSGVERLDKAKIFAMDTSQAKDNEWARAAVRSVVERCVLALAKQLERQAAALRRANSK